MKIRKTCIAVISLLMALMLFIVSCASADEPAKDANQDVIRHHPFYLDASDVGLGTTVQGTMFVRNDDQTCHGVAIDVVAMISVDTEDWGGVSFNLPDGWKIDSVLSDYPREQDDPEDYLVILQTASEDVDYPTVVEIGCIPHIGEDHQGGTGSLMMKLSPESDDIAIGDRFDMLIGVGSQGDHGLHPVHEVFSVSLE